MEPLEYGNKTRILIGEDLMNGVKMRVGFIVDAVDVICDVKAEEIETSFSSFTDQDDDHILAAVKTSDSIYLLLNLQEIMTPINKLKEKKVRNEFVAAI
jgi:chemotaxis signal transduction protein